MKNKSNTRNDTQRQVIVSSNTSHYKLKKRQPQPLQQSHQPRQDSPKLQKANFKENLDTSPDGNLSINKDLFL